MEIHKQIIQQLEQTQSKYNVKIPYAIESGSRAWGFASPDSDYDCRFIYVHEKDWYVSITQKRDVIEYAPDEVFDINGWDLKKMMQHVVKSNTVMFEWFLSNQIYIKNNCVHDELLRLMNDYFNPLAVSWHYLNTATKYVEEMRSVPEAKLKRYFYALRSFANLRYIYEHNKMPYTQFTRTLEQIQLPCEIKDRINQLLKIKQKVDEKYQIPSDKLLLQYFLDETDFFKEHLQNLTFKPKNTTAHADEVFRKIIDMVWKND